MGNLGSVGSNSILDDHAPRLNTICHKQVGSTAMLVDSESTENTGHKFGLPQKAEEISARFMAVHMHVRNVYSLKGYI